MTTHHASCHCGSVQYDVELELEGLATCNCSLCGRSGAIMAFVPLERVSAWTGRDELVDYQFGKKHIHHAFCRTCGMRPIAWGAREDGVEWAMINVRCLAGVDAHTLEVNKHFDGASL